MFCSQTLLACKTKTKIFRTQTNLKQIFNGSQKLNITMNELYLHDETLMQRKTTRRCRDVSAWHQTATNSILFSIT